MPLVWTSPINGERLADMCADRIVTDGAPSRISGRNAVAVYWHRQLPPMDGEIIGEHVLEATSDRVRGSLVHRDEVWESCYRNLMDNAEARLMQEIRRLGGDCAHVLSESIDSRHNDATAEAWLHGRFDYVLYRRPRSAAEAVR